MKTRDGVTLYADIYRPNSLDKFPVILMRTPYDKSVSWAVGPAAGMVRRGYVVVIQDVRGRYTSAEFHESRPDLPDYSRSLGNQQCVLKGHSIRREVASSNFPRFDRNLNTGEEIKFARTSVAATNVILHDAQHPSALVLPVMP